MKHGIEALRQAGVQVIAEKDVIIARLEKERKEIINGNTTK